MSSSLSDRGLLAPEYTSRRARRDAERAAAAAAPSATSPTLAVDMPQQPDIAAPAWLRAQEAAPDDVHDGASDAERRSAVPRRPIPRPTFAPSRRARTWSKLVISSGAMLSVVGLAIGVSVPAAATFRVDTVPEISAESLRAELPQPLAASAPASQPIGFDLRSTGAMDLGGAVWRAESTFGSESKAEALRALYLSAGRPFEPGFIPTTGSIRWPYPKSVEISSGFGDRDIGFHGGTDFVPGYGTPVGAIADGVVTWVGRDRTNFGYYVTIAHVIDGVRVDSLYAHLVDDSSAAYEIYPGLEVEVGALIGDTGNTGFSTGPHLHLEIHLEGEPVNPYEWLTINAR